jgi:hypothetical protein
MTDMLNPFADLKKLLLPQNFTETAGVKKILSTVPVKRPDKQDFIRVHPGEDYRASPVGLIVLKTERETYFVTPDMSLELANEFTLTRSSPRSTAKVSCSCGRSDCQERVGAGISNGFA